MAKKKNTEVALENATPAKKTQLFAKTATEIGERFGYDAPVLVSKKSWLALAAKEKLAEVAAEEGL